MFESRIEKVFDVVFQGVLPKVSLQTQPIETLYDIKDNPSYYAGWCIIKYCGSFRKWGDTHCEQNHSSVVSLLEIQTYF